MRDANSKLVFLGASNCAILCPGVQSHRASILRRALEETLSRPPFKDCRKLLLRKWPREMSGCAALCVPAHRRKRGLCRARNFLEDIWPGHTWRTARGYLWEGDFSTAIDDRSGRHSSDRRIGPTSGMPTTRLEWSGASRLLDFVEYGFKMGVYFETPERHKAFRETCILKGETHGFEKI